jgi:methionyl-tRNA formyltransferase
MGTPEFAVPTLTALARSGHEIVAVYTRESKRAGRGLTIRSNPIAQEAERLGLPLFTQKTSKGPEVGSALRAHEADAAIVVAYGLILPKTILDIFPLGCFNLHASLLPRWRGAAPINRAIMAGDLETGVTVMKMDEGLDTGPIAALMTSDGPAAMALHVPIDSDMTAGELHDELKWLGPDALLRALAALEIGTLCLMPQANEYATYADKIDENETRIEWSWPCQEVHNYCRGLSPKPGAWFDISGLGRVKVLRTAIGIGDGPPGRVLDDKPTIACGNGAVRLVELQRAGGKRMLADAFWRGLSIAPTTLPG